VPQESNLYQKQVPVRLVLPANTKIKMMPHLPLANIVKLEKNLSQKQVPAHLVLPANTKIKIMLRLPLANFVQLEQNSIRQQRRVHPVVMVNTKMKIMTTHAKNVNQESIRMQVLDKQVTMFAKIVLRADTVVRAQDNPV
jgi:hypothetical protein